LVGGIHFGATAPGVAVDMATAGATNPDHAGSAAARLVDPRRRRCGRQGRTLKPGACSACVAIIEQRPLGDGGRAASFLDRGSGEQLPLHVVHVRGPPNRCTNGRARHVCRGRAVLQQRPGRRAPRRSRTLGDGGWAWLHGSLAALLHLRGGLRRRGGGELLCPEREGRREVRSGPGRDDQ